MRRCLFFCLAIWITAPIGSAGDKPDKAEKAEKAGVKQLVALFETRYRPAQTLQATFLERYVEGGTVVRAEAGQVYFRRPGKMRWEYESPEKDVFLVDGKNAWFYVPEDHTVTRVPAKESTDWRTPLALLAGEMKVSRVCSRVELAVNSKPENPDNALLYCAVRGAEPNQGNAAAETAAAPSGKGDAVFFEIVRSTGELARLQIRQSGGVEVDFRFGNWQMDSVIAAAMFRFEPPAGVAIVNGELPASNGTVK